MKSFRLTLLAAAISIVAPTFAGADALPDGAQPMSGASIQKIYAGHSALWSKSKAFFAPDGSVKGLYTGDGDGIYWGTWSVKGNEICMVYDWRDVKTDEQGKGKDCWKWYVAQDKKPWTIYTFEYDKNIEKKGDYYTSELSKLKKGDKVTKEYNKLGS